MFLQVSVSPHPGGVGVRGFIWGGACVVLFGGCAWFYSRGACMVLFRGACMVFSVFSDTMRYWNAFLLLKKITFSKAYPTLRLLRTLRVRLHQVSASRLRWRLRFCSHWKQWSRLKMGCKPILEWLLCFQWEQNRKHHRSLDADTWCKWALIVPVEILSTPSIQRISTHSSSFTLSGRESDIAFRWLVRKFNLLYTPSGAIDQKKCSFPHSQCKWTLSVQTTHQDRRGLFELVLMDEPILVQVM